jgi:rod shape-determining protein MreD
MYRRWLFTFLTLLLLWTLIAQVNHYLAVWHTYVFVGALYVTFSALRLPPRTGTIVTVLGGLLCDGNTPVPFGTHVLLFLTAHVLIQNARARIPVDQTVTQVVIALLTNLGLYLAFALFMAVHQPAPGSMWPRQLMDLLVSQVLLVVIAPWFFSLQTRVLSWADRRAPHRF